MQVHRFVFEMKYIESFEDATEPLKMQQNH